MGNPITIRPTVVNVLFIHRRDQKWESDFAKLNDVSNFKVVFKEERSFEMSYLSQFEPDIVVIPLTLSDAMSLEVAKFIHLHKQSCKILLCSDTKVHKPLLDKVFDLHIERFGTQIDDMKNAIDELVVKPVERIKDRIIFEAFFDAIILRESWFGPDKKHGGITLAEQALMEKNVKQSLRYYLLFVLITMVCSLYSLADTLYKQFITIGPKDFTIIFLFIIPFLWPFVYTYYHHNMGETLNQKEKRIYVISIIVELIAIAFFVRGSM